MHNQAARVADDTPTADKPTPDLTAPSQDEQAFSIAPVSFAQQRLWFFDRLLSGSALYNVGHTEAFSGACDVAVLQKTLDEIVRRHEALRTTFKNMDGNPVQVIWRAAKATVRHIDLIDRGSDQVKRVIADETSRGFDLEQGPLARFTLIEVEDRRQLFVVVAHHIVFDLWSSNVFAHEFATLHDAFKAGRASPLPEPTLHYSAYVAAQRPRFDPSRHDPQLDYWRKRLANMPATTELPTDRPRPAVQTYRGALRTYSISPDIARPFRELTRGADTTLFMSLFAAFALLIHRYSGQSDLAIGTPIANRSKPGLSDMIGFLLNMLVLRIDFEDDPSVREMLARVRQMALEAFDNQDVPFELLVEDLKPDRDPSRNPMFQTMFVFQPGRPGQEATNEGPQDEDSNGSKFDLTLTIQDAAPSLSLALEYNTDLFDVATMDRIAGHFEMLLTSMAAHPDQHISQLEMLKPKERRMILEGWNANKAEWPREACLHTLFESVARNTPDAIAVSQGDAKLTYAELDQRVDALAAVLRGYGVGAEVKVGICMERSLEWIVAIFAVLKSGGAMVPLDASFPPGRLEFMIEDASVQVILTQTQVSDRTAGCAARVIYLDQPLPHAEPHPATPVKNTDLAYVVYTSGSTGKPKGVLVQHDGAVNFMVAQMKDWAIGPGAKVLQFTAFGFDIGLSEIFLTLCSGAEFVLAPDDDLIAGPPLMKTLRDLAITHVTLPPAALAAMHPEALPDLKLLISAGEPCEPGLARRWATGRRVVNAYGPTEATIYVTIGEFTAPNSFPVGRPIANLQAYVLDRHGAPVPPGVTGEIHMGGICVARGYLNRPELTAERFIPDPFSDRPKAKLYKTGDFGRFDADGTLHHLGRMDGQLKIRGYRVEPGEIENVLRQHPQVTDALVLGYGSGPDARLLAYIIATNPPPLVIELRSFLARSLPDYMAPAAYMMVDAWPKTSNGKIDRLALPRPDSLHRDVATAFVAPGNETEQTIAAIWRDVLAVEQVGVTDNFFDLGGHSLLLVRVYDQLKEKLKLELSLIDLFRFPTIKRQAEMLEAKVSSRVEVETLGRTDQRAARQNAARMNRRQRTGADRHA